MTGSAGTMVAEAKKHLGFRETPENDTQFNHWLGRIVKNPPYPHNGFGYPWCHSFLSYCLAHSGNESAGPRTAGCASGVSWFKSHGRFNSNPKVGDFVYYGAGGTTHVELVAGVTPNAIVTIGGNTSGSLGGNYFNGDGVYQKTVDRSSSRIYGYGHPTYAGTATGGGSGVATASTGTSGTVTPITSIRTIRQQQEAVNALGHSPPLDVDDDWGPKTEAGVKWLQHQLGVNPDGQWGQKTEAKYKAHGH